MDSDLSEFCCNVCFEPRLVSMLAPCGHSLCPECAADHYRHGLNHNCPFCRKALPVCWDYFSLKAHSPPKEKDVRDFHPEFEMLCGCDDSFDIVKRIIDSNVDISQPGKSEMTPLWVSAMKEQTDVVQLLLDSNASVDRAEPLGAVSLKGNLGLAKLLVESGMEVNQNYEGHGSALFMACYGQFIDIVRYLCDQNADPNISRSDGVTPLFLACEKENQPIVELLLAKKANPNATKTDGTTPLIMSCWRQNTGIIKCLLKNGADIDARRYHGSALCVSIWQNDYDLCKLLFENGANVNIQTSEGATPLIIASYMGLQRFVESFIEWGADVNHVMKDGTTAFSTSLKNKNMRIARYLIRHNANLTVQRDVPGVLQALKALELS